MTDTDKARQAAEWLRAEVMAARAKKRQAAAADEAVHAWVVVITAEVQELRDRVLALEDGR